MKPLTRSASEAPSSPSPPPSSSSSLSSTPRDAARQRASNATLSLTAHRRCARRVVLAEKSPPSSSSSLDALQSRARAELIDRTSRASTKRARDDGENANVTRSTRARRLRTQPSRARAQSRGVTVRSLGDAARRDARACDDASSCADVPGAAPFASVTGHEPRTRRETALRARREANEVSSGLLGTLCEDALWMVCSRLSALDLVALEQTSAYFRESARATDQGLGLCERIAHERVRGVPMVGMPPFYRKASWKQKLRIIEQRAEKINTETLKSGMWLRVREDAGLVKRMCIGADKSVVGYPVGWEPGMEKTCGKCYRVTVVSREYRQTPVIGLSVADGLVAISRGATSTYGWYFPVEALEHI